MSTKNYLKYLRYFIYILITVFILQALWLNSTSYLDNDLGWHLRVGEEIWHTKQVPHYEQYVYPLEGRTWADHEWLTNLAMYLVFSYANYNALTFSFIVIIALTLLLITWWLKNEKFLKSTTNQWLYIGFLWFGLYSSLPHLGIRVQEITLLCFTILLILLHYFHKTNNKKILYFLPPLIYLWSNLHGGFMIAFLILGLWVAVHSTGKILQRYKTPYIDYQKLATIPQIKSVIIITIISLLSTLFTPYGIGLYSFLSDYTNTHYLTSIVEWLPLHYYPIMYNQIFYSCLIISAVIITVLSTFFKFKNQQNKVITINLWEITLVTLFFILAFKSRRHFPLFFIVSLPFILNFIQQNLQLSKRYLKTTILPTIFYIALGIHLINVNIIYYKNIRWNIQPFSNSSPYCATFACKAINYLKTNEGYQHLTIFNDYNLGGYLTYVWKEKQLFIDGRIPLHPINNQTLLEEYQDFYDPLKTAQQLDRYEIQLVLLQKDREIKLNWLEKNFLGWKEEDFNQENHLVKYLNANHNWKIVFEDENSVIYTKHQ